MSKSISRHIIVKRSTTYPPIQTQFYSHDSTIRTVLPIGVELAPASLRGLAHLQCMDDEIVSALGGHLALAHVAAHSDIEQEAPVLDGAGAGGHDIAHDGSAIHEPHQTAPARTFAIVRGRGAGAAPGEVEADGAGMHVRDVGGADEVLGGVLGVVVAPVEAGVVDAVAVPGLGDVDLALVRPDEWLTGQRPECGPDARRAWKRQPRGETAVRATERPPRHQPRRCVPGLRVRGPRTRHRPHYQPPVRRVEAVLGPRRVVL